MILPSLQSRLVTDTGFAPVMAAEIEFYLFGANVCADLPDFWEALMRRCTDEGITLQKIEAERGAEQFEVAMPPRLDMQTVAESVSQFKHILSVFAEEAGMRASFSAHPHAGQPGSGLHLHLHVEDGEGRNVYTKREQEMSVSLAHSIGGLLAALPESMPLFAPFAESYTRFQPDSNVPVTVSWGANNRTVALRLPDKPSEKKHIEHRVSGADTDPFAAVAAILAGLHWGLTQKVKPGQQIYGDAALPMYTLPRLPASLEEALACMRAGKILSTYFDAEALWRASAQRRWLPEGS